MSHAVVFCVKIGVCVKRLIEFVSCILFFDVINSVYNFRIVFSDLMKSLKDKIACKIIRKRI